MSLVSFFLFMCLTVLCIENIDVLLICVRLFLRVFVRIV